MRRASSLSIAFLAATLAGPAIGQKVDIPSTSAAVPPSPNVSEDTVVSYTGAVPPTFTGALDADDSTYNRLVSCGSLSGVGTAVAYDTVTITNAAAGTASFVVYSSLVGGAACGDANDTFLTLYDTAFNPASPLTGCLAVNDDISGATNRCSRLTFSVPTGQTRVVVVAGFNNAAAGGLFAYQVNFDGTTPVELSRFTAD